MEPTLVHSVVRRLDLELFSAVCDNNEICTVLNKRTAQGRFIFVIHNFTHSSPPNWRSHLINDVNG
jgi:hypothetical protein